MLIVSIILIIVSILLVIQSVHSIRNVHQINEAIDATNRLKQEKLDELDELIKEKNNDIEDIILNQERIQSQYSNDINRLRTELEHADSDLKNRKQQLEDIQTNVTKTIENQKVLSQVAFENYCQALIKSYDEKEEEYQANIDRLKNSYAEAQMREMENLNSSIEENNKILEEQKEKINQEIAAAQETLDQIRATRDAALKAQLREKEILENSDNFRLKLSEASLKDIRLLKSIQSEITNAIVIDKIIQSNYYQPLAKTRFPQIIGKPTACGIYKITSIETGLSYIGQSNDICDRQKQHCKNALGVGNITTENKLYKAMRADGLFNFTFEVLEECGAQLLDEKEKYYINLYDTYNYGLNGTQGNSK